MVEQQQQQQQVYCAQMIRRIGRPTHNVKRMYKEITKRSKNMYVHHRDALAGYVIRGQRVCDSTASKGTTAADDQQQLQLTARVSKALSNIGSLCSPQQLTLQCSGERRVVAVVQWQRSSSVSPVVQLNVHKAQCKKIWFVAAQEPACKNQVTVVCHTCVHAPWKQYWKR
eukprot:9986-Heterococcus_DN1.PRE.2